MKINQILNTEKQITHYFECFKAMKHGSSQIYE